MNWFDIFVLIVTAYSFIKGYRSGLIKQLAALAGLIAGAIIAGKVSIIIQPYISQFLKLSTPSTIFISYILAFILIILVFYFIGTMIDNIVSAIRLGFINKTLGAIFCLAKYYILISIVLNLVLMLDFKHKIINDNIRENAISYLYIKEIAPSIVPSLQLKGN